MFCFKIASKLNIETKLCLFLSNLLLKIKNYNVGMHLTIIMSKI